MDVATQEPTEDLLNDTGELETGDTPVFSGVEADDPVHLAKCSECASAVRFRPNVTGTGFFLVDEAPDVTFGIGPNGRPVCPNGHGEMSIADDKIPAADAFSEVAAMQGAQQRSLPGVFPPFNFEGAFKEIVEQAQRVENLDSEYDAAKAEASEAKKALDKGAELLMRMTLEFERRRKEKPDVETAPPADRQPCTWEAKHPTLRACPICTGLTAAAVIERLIGSDVPPADAAAHAESVDTLLFGLELDELEDTLGGVDLVITRDEIGSWAEDDRAAVLTWAVKSIEHASGVPDITVPERPAILGKPHIPSQLVPGEHQVCAMCEVVIRPASEIEAYGPYKLTDLVGVDCAGKVPKVGHHYPKSSKKKPAAGEKKTGKARR